MTYTWAGMEKISEQQAIQRFNAEEEVYLLHDDNTEALAESVEEIREHYINGGEFGIERSVF